MILVFAGSLQRCVDHVTARYERERYNLGMPAPRTSPSPLLVLVTGKPGSGKSTLARRLAEEDALGLPLLSRDALKVGLVETYAAETDAVRATIVPLSYRVFYDTIALWLRGGVSLIAEYGFVRARSETDIRPLTRLAHAVVVHCDTPDEEARRRFVARERTNPRARPDLVAALIGRMERGEYDWAMFGVPDLGVPTLRVDTTRGYAPGLDTIAAFCRSGRAGDGIREESGGGEAAPQP